MRRCWFLHLRARSLPIELSCPEPARVAPSAASVRSNVYAMREAHSQWSRCRDVAKGTATERHRR